MTTTRTDHTADIVYRATLADGREVEQRLRLPPGEATVTDAWRRLSAAHPTADPMTIEIEIYSSSVTTLLRPTADWTRRAGAR